MKYFLIYISIFVSSLFLNIAFPQVYYFNDRFGYGSSYQADVSRSLIEVENGYIIGGMSDWNYTGSFYLGFRKVDFEGNEIWTKTIGETNRQYWIGEPGSLIKTANGGYLMCGTYKNNTVITDAALLVKFDENFDTLWTKKRSDTITPSNYLYYYFQCKEIINEGYIIIGVKMPYGEASKMHLVKTDYNGNIIWEQVYGTGTYYYQTFSVIQTTDGGYAIGGYRFIIGQNETADPIIYKTDSLGNLEWEKNLGGPYFDYHPMLTLGKDGNIVVGTCIADSMSTPSSGYSRINIVKLDNLGNVIWNKKYGQSITYNFLKQIRTTSDGSYIATGHVKNNYPHMSGWIIKIAENGDSLWYRQYDNLLGYQSENRLFDIQQVSDNGFIACGYVFPMSPDPGSQDAWVLKVDSMGCDTPGCNTGVNMFEWIAEEKGELRVWPNPTKNKFEVRSSEFEVGGTKEIRVYNSQGLKVEEIQVPDGAESMEVDVSKYVNGLYYLQYIHSNQIVETVKFIKN